MDKKALDAAATIGWEMGLSLEATEDIVRAYLAAAPGEYGGLVAKLQDEARRDGVVRSEAADAIATLSAKLAAAEARWDCDHMCDHARELSDKLTAAEARADEAELERDKLRGDCKSYALTMNSIEEVALREAKELLSVKARAEVAEARADEAVRQFTEQVLHGDDEHRTWLREAAECFLAGQPMPASRGLGRAEAAEAREAKLRKALEEARGYASLALDRPTLHNRSTLLSVIEALDRAALSSPTPAQGGEND